MPPPPFLPALAFLALAFPTLALPPAVVVIALPPGVALMAPVAVAAPVALALVVGPAGMDRGLPLRPAQVPALILRPGGRSCRRDEGDCCEKRPEDPLFADHPAPPGLKSAPAWRQRARPGSNSAITRLSQRRRATGAAAHRLGDSA